MDDAATIRDPAGDDFLRECRALLAACRAKVAHCLAQLSDEQVWWRPTESMNSVANLVLHLCGNLDQRIGSVVGGGPDERDRPREFSERGPIPPAELARRFDRSIRAADSVLAGLTPDRLLDPRTYRGTRHDFEGTVQAVILRTLVHLAGHMQEVIGLTRQQLGDRYRFLSDVSPEPMPI